MAIKIDIKVEYESSSFVGEILEYFDREFHVSEIHGYLNNLEGDCVIIMDNGDVITYVYQYAAFPGVCKEYHFYTINGQRTDLPVDCDESQIQVIARAYGKYVDQRKSE